MIEVVSKTENPNFTTTPIFYGKARGAARSLFKMVPSHNQRIISSLSILSNTFSCTFHKRIAKLERWSGQFSGFEIWTQIRIDTIRYGVRYCRIRHSHSFEWHCLAIPRNVPRFRFLRKICAYHSLVAWYGSTTTSSTNSQKYHRIRVEDAPALKESCTEMTMRSARLKKCSAIWI